MIVLIDNYDSFTWNLYHFLGDLGAETVVHRNDTISVHQVISSRPSAIVISPGPGVPADAGIIVDLVKQASSAIPIFGVCLGHQAIGQAFGAKVIRAKTPKHGKQSLIKHNGQGVFRESKGPFLAARYHSLVVDREELPSCLEITAETEDGLIMGLRHRSFAIEGVQFHPESIATPDGQILIQNFLRRAS